MQNKEEDKLAEQCYLEVEKFFDHSLFKILSESVRWDIIKFLTFNGRCDVGTIAKGFKQDRSVISRHLSQMFQLGILHKTKESRSVYYDLNCKELLAKFENITESLREITEYDTSCNK